MQHVPGHILYLNSCGLDQIHFPNLKHIRIASLDNNRLKSIPSALFSLPNLAILSLQHNYIQTIPSEITKLTMLEALHLMHNKILSVKQCCDLLGLKVLNVSVNYIVSIPQDIINLGNLEYLDLAKNAITEFPTLLFRLPKLQFLSLSHNFISIVPSDFESSCIWLKGLMLDFNNLQSIPSSLANAGKHGVVTIYGNIRLPNWRQMETVQQYIEDFSEGEANCNTIKLLVLGNGGVGLCSTEKLIF